MTNEQLGVSRKVLPEHEVESEGLTILTVCWCMCVIWGHLDGPHKESVFLNKNEKKIKKISFSLLG